MKVRFILSERDETVYDKTVNLPYVPAEGEMVGIEITDGAFANDPDAARLVEVESRRLYVHGEEPVAVVRLTDSPGGMRANQYVYHGCRFGYERMMENVARHGR